jgi:hypothetical protein
LAVGFTPQVSRQWVAFATALDRGNDLFIRSFVCRLNDTFCFIEEGQLRRRWISGLLGFRSEQTLKQEGILLFQPNNLVFIQLTSIFSTEGRSVGRRGIMMA